MRDILDPKYGMFKTIEENHLIWFNKQVYKHVFVTPLQDSHVFSAVFCFTGKDDSVDWDEP
jgi:hypothetical protein